MEYNKYLELAAKDKVATKIIKEFMPKPISSETGSGRTSVSRVNTFIRETEPAVV